MKPKATVKRWSRKTIIVGDSLAVTIPHDVAKQWQIVQGTEMVVYQLHKAFVLVPLQTLLEHGELKILKPLQEALT